MSSCSDLEERCVCLLPGLTLFLPPCRLMYPPALYEELLSE